MSIHCINCGTGNLSATLPARYNLQEDKLVFDRGFSSEIRLSAIPRDTKISCQRCHHESKISDYSGLVEGFDGALLLLRRGKHARRKAWEGNDYIHIEETRTCGTIIVYVKNPNQVGNCSRPWVPTTEDMFALDWVEKL